MDGLVSLLQSEEVVASAVDDGVLAFDVYPRVHAFQVISAVGVKSELEAVATEDSEPGPCQGSSHRSIDSVPLGSILLADFSDFLCWGHLIHLPFGYTQVNALFQGVGC